MAREPLVDRLRRPIDQCKSMQQNTHFPGNDFQCQTFPWSVLQMVHSNTGMRETFEFMKHLAQGDQIDNKVVLDPAMAKWQIIRNGRNFKSDLVLSKLWQGKKSHSVPLPILSCTQIHNQSMLTCECNREENLPLREHFTISFPSTMSEIWVNAKHGYKLINN